MRRSFTWGWKSSPCRFCLCWSWSHKFAVISNRKLVGLKVTFTSSASYIAKHWQWKMNHFCCEILPKFSKCDANSRQLATENWLDWKWFLWAVLHIDNGKWTISTRIILPKFCKCDRTLKPVDLAFNVTNLSSLPILLPFSITYQLGEVFILN